MARIFDVIEYPSEMPDEIVHHFPETGVADIRWGSQLIVRESQNAIFMRDGKALDVFGPGRHTLSTANLPLLTNLLGKAFNNRTPFTAEVYYVAMREFADRKPGKFEDRPFRKDHDERNFGDKPFRKTRRFGRH